MTTQVFEHFDDAQAVTLSDTANLDGCRGFYVGTAGDVTIVTPSGHTVTFKTVPAGTVLKVAAAIIKATGTTASNIVALF